MNLIGRLIFTAATTCVAGIVPIANAAKPGESYLQQADSFLASMPPKLQQRQTEAIHLAIEGDTAKLNQIRAARNTPAKLPPQVIRTDIGPNLALFQRNDTRKQATPLLIYFHGGGWTIGSINSCSRFCAEMALNGITVLAVDYRLAPENKFPAGLNDCIDAVETATASLGQWNCNSISLGGDSSGGNLAIATAMSFPKNTFTSLVAFYPVTKAYPDNSSSWHRYGHGFGLDSALMEAFNNAYTTDIHNHLVSPAEASDQQLSQLPPTLIIAAGRDILTDQGREFADRLKKLDLPICYELIPDAVHLFITVPGQADAFNRATTSATRFISTHTP